MKKVEIEIPEGKKAVWENNVLTLVDDKPKNITDRIKTFEDAVNELGEDHPSVIAYNGCMSYVASYFDNGSDIIAYLKLRIICDALNEGWKPKLIVNERRYYPLFRLYTNEEYNNLSDKEKENIHMLTRSDIDKYACRGIAYLDCYGYSSNLFSSCSTQLAFKNSKLAKYAVEQFIDIYADLNM